MKSRQSDLATDPVLAELDEFHSAAGYPFETTTEELLSENLDNAEGKQCQQ